MEIAVKSKNNLAGTTLNIYNVGSDFRVCTMSLEPLSLYKKCICLPLNRTAQIYQQNIGAPVNLFKAKV